LNQNFAQTISIRSADPDAIIEILEQWDRDQASAEVMGYMGVRLLADRDAPGEYMIMADFGIVDPDVSAVQEAAMNNDRAETQAAAAKLRAVVQGEPVFRNYDCIYQTEG